MSLLPVGCRRKAAAELGPDAGRFERSRLWNYPDEQWDDPQTRKEARLQFVWAAPDEKSYSIFSIRLDGTDLRRVVGPELLYTGEAKSLQQTVRSPDRRYLACVGDDAQANQLRFLVDLKARSLRTMSKTTSPTELNWTPDSRRVLFYGDEKLWQYEVESGTVAALPMIWSSGLHLVDGGRRFVAVRSGRIELRDPSGLLLKSIEVPYKTDGDHVVSDDGRYIAFHQVPFVIVDLQRAGKPVFTSPESFAHPAFAPDGRTLFFFSDHLNALDVASGEVKQLARLPAPWSPGSTTALAPVRGS
jgi:Tol biopolymer transport system component